RSTAAITWQRKHRMLWSGPSWTSSGSRREALRPPVLRRPVLRRPVLRHPVLRSASGLEAVLIARDRLIEQTVLQPRDRHDAAQKRFAVRTPPHFDAAQHPGEA